MKKTLIAFAALSLCLAPAASADGQGYKAKDFRNIEVDGAMRVVYTAGPATRVVARNADGDYSDVRITNKGDTLRVTRVSTTKERGWFSWGGPSINISNNGETVKVNGKTVPNYVVYVTGPTLDSVSAAQSSRFEASALTGESLAASASSDGTIILGGRVAEAELSASSAGEVRAAKLAAGQLNVSVSSSGEMEAFVDGSGSSSVNASSGSQVSVSSARASRFVVDASSGSTITLSGACSDITATASSGSSVEAEKLACVNMTANASSGASIDAYATGNASGDASSGASITISGAPSEKVVSKSSGGSVSFTS
jgi:hypothetical protein